MLTLRGTINWLMFESQCDGNQLFSRRRNRDEPRATVVRLPALSLSLFHGFRQPHRARLGTCLLGCRLLRNWFSFPPLNLLPRINLGITKRSCTADGIRHSIEIEGPAGHLQVRLSMRLFKIYQCILESVDVRNVD